MTPIRVVITEASHYTARSLAYRILSDCVFGTQREIILSLYDSGNAVFLESVAIEITASASPLLKDVIFTNDPAVAFKDADYVFAVGTGRDYNFGDSIDIGVDPFFRDSVLENKNNGLAIENYAKKTAKVITLGNTAAKIISVYAPSLPKENITGVMMDIQKFVAFFIAKKSETSLPSDVKNLIIWGSNNKKVLPYCNYVKLNDDAGFMKTINDDQWCKKTLPKLINGFFSKCRYKVSEATAAADHCKYLINGTKNDEWINMIVQSDGSYGVAVGTYFSFPVRCNDGNWKIVENLDIDDYGKRRFKTILASIEKKCDTALSICREIVVKKNVKVKYRRSVLKV